MKKNISFIIAITLLQIFIAEFGLAISESAGDSVGSERHKATQYSENGVREESSLCPDDLDALIQLNMAIYHIPGIAAVVFKDDQIVWEGYYGLSNILRDSAVTAERLFYSASTAKTIIATAVMQLVEDGLLDLNEDIDTYLPFSVRNPYFPSVPITTHMLLTHASSIAQDPPAWFCGMEWTPDVNAFGDELYSWLVPGGDDYDASHWLFVEPGNYQAYANHGMALAAYVVESISGVTYEQYCQDNIFGPLGMNESSFFINNLDWRRVAMSYQWNGSEYVEQGYYDCPSYPASSVKTSARQMARHVMAIMQGGIVEGTRILEQSSVDQILTHYYNNLGLGPFGQGYAWRHLEGSEYNPTNWWAHPGAGLGHIAGVWFDPAIGSGAVFFSNTDWNDGHTAIEAAIDDFCLNIDFILTDSDADGTVDNCDNCPNISNELQENQDGDEFGDICDNCPNNHNNSQSDIDNDGIGDVCDNCEEDANLDQSDVDEDSFGDVCDNCPVHHNPVQQDADGDGIGDICDYVCGDFDGNDNVSILDIVYLINFLYKNGVEPLPLDRMDANHDLTLSILDIVYILNFVYREGPDPICI